MFAQASMKTIGMPTRMNHEWRGRGRWDGGGAPPFGPEGPPDAGPGGPGGSGIPGENPQGGQAGDYHYVDVHGAGSQRSDPKAGDPAMFPHGRGPQGDVIRIYNYVRLVRPGSEP